MVRRKGGASSEVASEQPEDLPAWARFLRQLSAAEEHDHDSPEVWARFLARVTALLHGDEGGA